MAAKNFRDLLVWQSSYRLAIDIYKVTEKFPKSEQFGLTSQLRRAIVSVGSNIAEGFGRTHPREKDQFYAVANGSLSEVESQLLIAEGIGYIVGADFLMLELQCTKTHKMLYGLQKANKEKGARGYSSI